MEGQTLALKDRTIHLPLQSAEERQAQLGEDRLSEVERQVEDIVVEEEVFEHVVALLVDRILRHLDNVAILDGRKGFGKSTLALRIANAVLAALIHAGAHPKVRPYLGYPLNLERDIVYRLDHLLARVKPRTHGGKSIPGDVIVVDEGVLVAQSGPGKSRAVQVLEQAVSIMRRFEVTLLVLAPSIDEIAASVSGRGKSVLADYWMNIEDLGRAVPHEFEPRRHYGPFNRSQFQRFKHPYDTLHWQPFSASDPYWRRYEDLSLASKALATGDLETTAGALHQRALEGR